VHPYERMRRFFREGLMEPVGRDLEAFLVIILSALVPLW